MTPAQRQQLKEAVDLLWNNAVDAANVTMYPEEAAEEGWETSGEATLVKLTFIYPVKTLRFTDKGD